jgi:thioesterase domain-containing protein/acyl carrier protein
LAEANPDARVELVREFLRVRVATVLGTSASAVELDRPLSEMGLDSLMGVELVHRIESDIGASVPLSALARDMTVERLCAALLPALTGTRPDEGPPAPAALPHLGVVESRGPRIVHLAGDPATPPIYCIHPADGGLGVYRSLAEALSTSCSVYGLESQLLDDGGDTSPEMERAAQLKTIEELAKAYAAAIVAHRADDEAFRLFGFSLGGLIALRTSRVLEDRGRAVAFVGLAECDPTWGSIETQRVPRIAALLADQVEHLQAEFGALKDDAVDRLRQDAPEMARRLVDATDLTTASSASGPDGPSPHHGHVDGGALLVEWITQHGYLRENNLRPILNQYASRVVAHIRLLARGPHPGPRRAAIHVWNAAEGLAGDVANWDLAGVRPAEIHVLPGRHFQILAPPSNHSIAKRIRELVANQPGSL